MIVGFKQSETPLVTNAIVAVRELVALPAYMNGARLPSEPEVASRIGVSRPVLRQALAALKAEGLIQSRRGSGTYATGQHSATLTFGRPETLSDLEDCMRFRMVIESAAASEAARRADSASLNQIHRAVQRMKTGVREPNSVLGLDMEFHIAVARAARSRYYSLTLETLMPHIMLGLNLARQMRNIPATVNSKRVIAEHQKILSAIKNGDERRASAAMRQHLQKGIERIFGDRSW